MEDNWKQVDPVEALLQAYGTDTNANAIPTTQSHTFRRRTKHDVYMEIAKYGRTAERIEEYQRLFFEEQIAPPPTAEGIAEKYYSDPPPEFQPVTHGHTKALRVTQAWAAGDATAPRWLWLSGKPGLGKSHLASITLAAVVRRSYKSGTFVKVAGLLREARPGEGKMDPQGTTIEKYANVRHLVLDDMGAEKPSEFSIATLSELIDLRYDSKKPTIFTSNFELHQIAARMTVRGEEMAASRILDRLYEMTGGKNGDGDLVLTGQSWREK